MQMSPRTSTRKKLISTTYKIIWEQGIEGITIRKIANATSLSSAALYRHFENLDELLAYACIKFLEPCIEDYKFIERTTDDPLKISLKLWEVLANRSFYTPQIFSALFLSPYHTYIPQIVQNYYLTFELEIFNVEETLYYMKLITSILFNNEEYLLLHAHQCSKDILNIISDSTFYTYTGMLAILSQKEYPVSIVEEMLAKFRSCTNHIYTSIL